MRLDRPWLALLGGFAAGALLGGLLFFGLPTRSQDPPPEAASPVLSVAGLEVGERAPSFELSTPDGKVYSTARSVGKVLLLNFWATWCVPCRTEMPLLERTHAELRDQGLEVWGVDFDEPADLVTEFAEELGLTFPLLLDEGGAVQELYRVRGYPTTVILDREGNISAYHIGVLSEDQLRGYLAGAGLDP